MEYPELFDNQPEITPNLLADLEDRGLIVPEKSLHKSDRRTAEVSNPTAGEVIGYSLLAKKFKAGEITQDDARALLVIETTRDKGPRETHISRLMANVFVTDKTRITVKVQEWQAKKQK
jgi:hypothetical protein